MRWILYWRRLVFVIIFLYGISCNTSDHLGTRFEISFPDSLGHKALTGRLFLTISPEENPEPRIAAYKSARRRDARMPFFATNVEHLNPSEIAIIDGRSAGYPLSSLNELQAGDYYVQAVLHVYTEFHRSDGYTIWAPMDQWEGQRWAFSPGNLISEPQKLHLDPENNETFELELTKVLPPIQLPDDTKWVKRFKMESELLTKFWGHPIFIGATVLLPRSYAENTKRYYPVIFLQNHFSLDAPFSFSTVRPDHKGRDLFQDMRQRAGGKKESGYEFYKSWISDGFPEVIAVTFQHPSPYFDDSYAVNSANNGPYGDALLTELIPELEQRYRIINKPYARVLTGGSTGGWESLALQVYHPDFFGGTWTFYPDPVDFRQYQLINIYEDENAFIVPGAAPGAPERMFQRLPNGQPVATVRQVSQMEHASGTRGRSGAQIDIWNATYGPVGDDGYPKQLWDLETGEIDRQVAHYMRDNGYDLRHYIEVKWSEIGPKLVGKLHIYNPEMDDFYLPNAVYLLEEFLKNTTNPHFGGEVVHGRPMKGHGWQPMSNADLIREMAQHIAANTP